MSRGTGPCKEKEVLVGYNSWTIVTAKHGTSFVVRTSEK